MLYIIFIISNIMYEKINRICFIYTGSNDDAFIFINSSNSRANNLIYS